MSWGEMKTATALVVKSELRDDSSEYDLRKWVVAIALGKIVYVDRGIEDQPRNRFYLTAALGRPHVNVRFTQRFADRHSELAKITSAVAKCDGSKWRVAVGSQARRGTSSSDAQVKEIDSHERFVGWLRSMAIART